ncbi:MAG: AAA family ATPase [Magnetococcales bacterium]|nr:AAA family ATPase [Magnetococcales bacterium]NGZ05121.1 AAA family ATPase [Magnetococcales bacterium]
MNLEYFGLHTFPFSPTPDTERFFSGGGREELIQGALSAILAGEGFIQVLGASGAGKTMLCRMLCQRLPHNFRAALLLNPTLPPDDLIPAILSEYRIPIIHRSDRLAARHTLLNHLMALHRKGESALLLIDEAHCLPLTTLEELRLLGNLETGHDKLLQIVLFAQPQMERLLQEESARPLQERMTTRMVVAPWSAQETARYLQFRLHAAGFQPAQLFTTSATRLLHILAQGSLHTLHRLAHQAMHQAQQRSSRLVTPWHVLHAITHGQPRIQPKRGRTLLATAGIVALLAATLPWIPWDAHHGWTPWDAQHSVERIPASHTLPAQTNTNTTGIRDTTPGTTDIKVATPGTTDIKVATPTPATLATPHPAEQMTPRPMTAASSEPVSPRPLVSAHAEPVATPLPLPKEEPSEEEKPILVPDELLFLADASTTPLSQEAKGSSVTPPKTPYLKTNDPLAEIIRASHRWLDQGPENHFTIQLILLRQEKGLETLINQLAAVQPPLGRTDLKVFRLKDDALLVYLNECSSLVECEALKNRLPVALRSNNPSVRSLARLKTTVRKLALATADRTG